MHLRKRADILPAGSEEMVWFQVSYGPVRCLSDARIRTLSYCGRSNISDMIVELIKLRTDEKNHLSHSSVNIKLSVSEPL